MALMMKKQVIRFFPQLVPLTGNHRAATVLSQIFYWQSRLQVKKHGILGLAKSRAEMCKETELSLNQYKRVMTTLVQQGWITVERTKFENQVTPFIRLTELGQYTRQQCMAQNATNQLAHFATNQLAQKPTNSLTETTTESTTEDLAKTQAQGQGGSVKADEILKQHKSQTVEGNIGSFWQKRMALLSGHMQYPLTAKERGQLSQLQKKLGDRTRAVVDFAMNNWWKFASAAGASAGCAFPGDPQIGFLLKYCQVASDLLQPVAQVMVESQIPVEVPPQPVYDGEEEKPHLITKQELEDMLAGLKE